MYKVFIDNKPVLFSQNFLNPSIHGGFRGLSERYLEQNNIYSLRDETPEKLLVVKCKEPEQCIRRTFADHQFVEAAGGIVKSKRRYLLILRRGVWDLPKGHLDSKESPQAAAVREVEEECGIESPVLGRFVGHTWHVYEYQGRKVLKRTWWYKMSWHGTGKPRPQMEEDITAVKWLKRGEVRRVLKGSYASIQDIFARFLKF